MGEGVSLSPTLIKRSCYEKISRQQGDDNPVHCPCHAFYDSDGVLKYRNVIKARNKIAEDKLTDFLINVDHFQAAGLNGESSLTFLSSKSAVFSGFDGDQDLGNINFTYKFSGNASNTDDEYEFTITEFPNDINDLQCVKFYLDFTGCMLHLMTANITVDIYLPVYSV